MSIDQEEPIAIAEEAPLVALHVLKHAPPRLRGVARAALSK